MNKLVLLLIIPTFLDNLLYQTNCSGNFGLHGVFLDIYIKRNLFYGSLFLLFIGYLYNYILYAIILVILSLFLFIKSINKWNDVLLHWLNI